MNKEATDTQAPTKPVVETFTIQDETFTVDLPFSEGHVCNINEAHALNQTRKENLRNNFASRISKAKAELGEGQTLDIVTLQKEFDEKAAKYEFGVRQGSAGRRPSDPIEGYAYDIAQEAVIKHLKDNKVEGITKADIHNITLETLANNKERLMTLGQQRLEQMTSIQL